MRFLRFVLCILFFLCFFSPLWSQELNSKEENTSNISDNNVKSAADRSFMESRGAHKLGKVVVTATKTAHKAGDSPASVSVVDSDDISVSSGKQLNETLKSIPGLYLKHSKISDTSSVINIRGFQGYSSNLILWNGMPLNEPYGANPNWAGNSTASTERIEVVKGPFSSLYGRNAMGGVVNIITKVPMEQTASVKIGYGSNNTYTGEFLYGDRYYDSLSVFLSFDYKHSDGTRNNLVTKTFNTGNAGGSVTGAIPSQTRTGAQTFIIGDTGKNYWDQSVATMRFTYDINTDTRIEYSFKYAEYEYGYNNPRSYLKDPAGHAWTNGAVTIDIDGTDYTATINPRDFISGLGNKKVATHVADFSTNAGDILLKVKAGLNTNENYFSSSPPSGAHFAGGPGRLTETDPAMTLYTDIQADIPLLDIMLLTLGTSFRHDSAENRQWTLFDWRDLESINTSAGTLREVEGKQLFSSFYSQLEYNIIKDMLIIYGGARYDHWRNYDGYSKYLAVEENYSETTDWFVSPKASVLFKPGVEAVNVKLESLKASFGYAYSPPDINQLYTYSESGSVQSFPDPKLKPEKSRSFETGVDISAIKRRVLFTATYFQSVIDDMIYRKTINATTRIQANAGRGEISGFELEARVFPVNNIELFFNATKTDTEITRNEADPDSVGKNFQYVPEWMYNAGLKAFYNNFEGSVNWRYSDRLYATSDNTDVVTGVYGSWDRIKLLDLKFSAMPHENVKFSVSINNALDREYYQYYLSEGRTYFAEAEVKF